MIKVSVIIPCYNAEQFIKTGLESVARQTLQPLEVIVIDDGSNDRSLDVIHSSRHDLPLKVLASPRLGGAGARNIGIRAAEGEWLAFLDADDVWYPNHLERAIDIIRRFEPIGYINHYDHISPEGGLTLRHYGQGDTIVEGFGLDDYIHLILKYRHFVGMSACLVEKHRALAVGGIDESQVRRHDIEFWLRVVHGQRWVFDELVTSAYRKGRPGSLSNKYAEAAYDGLRAFIKHRDKTSDVSSYDIVLQKRARDAILSSLKSQDKICIQRAYELGFNYLSQKHKFSYGIIDRFSFMYPIFRLLKLI
jgi:glycosyltransferase involved in cell wall biosynthesis